jgi:hypothetical protein
MLDTLPTGTTPGLGRRPLLGGAAAVAASAALAACSSSPGTGPGPVPPTAGTGAPGPQEGLGSVARAPNLSPGFTDTFTDRFVDARQNLKSISIVWYVLVDPRAIDGDFGPQTRASVEALQSNPFLWCRSTASAGPIIWSWPGPIRAGGDRGTPLGEHTADRLDPIMTGTHLIDELADQRWRWLSSLAKRIEAVSTARYSRPARRQIRRSPSLRWHCV